MKMIYALVLVMGLVLSTAPAWSAGNPDPAQSASTLAREAIGAARKAGKCVSVAIVDEGGHLFYFERDACAHLGSIETAIQKARSANAFRRPTSAFAEAVSGGNLGIVTAAGVMAVAGGLPVEGKGPKIGGIGVGGATAAEDEAFARQALERAR
ncbi:MAG: heme-binding protein [Bacteriovoracia bacterium]